MSEKLHQKNNNEGMGENWSFSDVPFMPDTANIDSDVESAPDTKIEEMLEEIEPFIERVEPKTLKKVFDGWKKRQSHYRQMMREEESMAGFSDAECDAWADLFYLGTIFRDYLDTILDLKRPEKSGFQLLDSTEEEVVKMGCSMGWFNSSEHMVNIIGDRLDSKFDFLGAIAHEMWHAHQVQIIEEEDSDRSDVYRKALRDYIGIEDPENNRNQLLEKEAYTFQYLFEQRMLEAMELAPEMREILTGNDGQSELNPEDFMDLIRSEEFPSYDFYDDVLDPDDWG